MRTILKILKTWNKIITWNAVETTGGEDSTLQKLPEAKQLLQRQDVCPSPLSHNGARRETERNFIPHIMRPESSNLPYARVRGWQRAEARVTACNTSVFALRDRETISVIFQRIHISLQERLCKRIATFFYGATFVHRCWKNAFRFNRAARQRLHVTFLKMNGIRITTSLFILRSTSPSRCLLKFRLLRCRRFVSSTISHSVQPFTIF